MTDKPKKDNPARLAELLGADSTNFLGTGLTMQEFMLLHDAEKIAASWSLQPLEERKRRLAAVTRLSVALAKVREITESSTRLAEMAIEAVIVGDWKMVEEWAAHFSFADERAEMRTQIAPIYAVFRELLLQVLRTQKALPT